MNAITRAALLAVTFLSTSAVQAQELTLEEAIRASIAGSPQVEATAATIEGLNAARDAADTGPAPTIEGTVENIGTAGFDQFQVDATYHQQLERGSKRQARIRLAEGEIGIAQAEALIRRLDLAQDVQELYVEAQAAALNIELAKSRVEIAETLRKEVQRRVDEARDPLFAGTRARTELAEAEVDLELAEHARDAAKARLALLTGIDAANAEIASEGFLNMSSPVGAGSDLSSVDLALFEARRQRADANFRLQEANGSTDPTLFAGPRYIGTGDVAVVAGVSLPLANRALNRANMERAAAEQRQVEADLAVERYQRRRDLALAVERVEEARHEAEAIRDKVVPGAEQTLKEVRAGYSRGGFTFLDVSAAQTALHAARVRFVDALTEYHFARIELDRLTGRFAGLVGGN
ncbi:TolC family protein [Croceicoccus sp. Ery5]|jgi:outer membrane protein, heavy metal efflux system|uniref:TolC family protein n=1 Tax=Croceicoccus sp. Ery5 TaxID=1703340 RepID=UPI001E4E2D88|nr:TolC family protein [Croceicoccus sp. Ery5]